MTGGYPDQESAEPPMIKTIQLHAALMSKRFDGDGGRRCMHNGGDHGEYKLS